MTLSQASHLRVATRVKHILTNEYGTVLSSANGLCRIHWDGTGAISYPWFRMNSIHVMAN